MHHLKGRIRQAFVGALTLATTGCSTTFDVTVPNSKAQAFTTCLSHARGVCALEDTKAIGSALVASSTTHFQGGATNRPVNTALDPTFRNPFAVDIKSLSAQAESQGQTTQYTLTSRANLAVLFASIEQLSPDQRYAAAVLAEDAKRFLGHPVQTKLNDLYNNLADQNEKGEKKAISFARSEMEDYVALGKRLSQQNGWQVHRTSSLVNLAVDPANPKKLQDASTALFIEAYIRAYFRNGEFYSGKVKVADIYDKYPDLKDFKSELDPILNKLESKLAFGKIGSTGFVTRTGTSLQVPPLELTLDPAGSKLATVSKVDASTVGAEVVRVILEAIFDSIDLLPAVSNATGIKLDVGRPLPGVLGLEDMATIKGRKVPTPQQFDKATQIANSIDTSASTITAEVIRGVNVVALNNEALAKIIETLVGTTARKVGEKVTYCWYACVDDPAPASLAMEKPLERTKTVTVTVSY